MPCSVLEGSLSVPGNALNSSLFLHINEQRHLCSRQSELTLPVHWTRWSQDVPSKLNDSVILWHLHDILCSTCLCALRTRTPLSFIDARTVHEYDLDVYCCDTENSCLDFVLCTLWKRSQCWGSFIQGRRK